MKRDGKVLWERALGWSYDLPKVGEVPKWRIGWASVKPAPNYFDDVFLELPRSSSILRGLTFLIGAAGLLLLLGITLYMYWSFLRDDWLMSLSVAIITPALSWSLIPYIKLDLVAPRDEPIRFNRLRQKIYIYEFRYDRIFIFSRKRWGVKPVAYNWDDVTAEVYRVYAPGHGGLIENVMLSVRNPETNEVIDRVFFTHDLYHGEAYWAIARLFMQQGPEALPKFVHPPRDWNDDDGLSHMHCLAPKVHWPEDIDRESRTAPSE
ncbi:MULTISPECIES: DUF6708 domain-containing protein [Pseudomonas]|uniref:DUF6708 domain-containing protein n=1 Tax=Pseudomonas TaxID=286 RepID=UPI001E62022F|nr:MULTISPECIES: DUF6708 domain-containing protein [Pseudomonas]MCE0853835.1 hypothetical protein [Pseudomonas asiatica]WDM86056.1 hypothetical protein LG197_15535 [Pseudomonas asiatica]